MRMKRFFLRCAFGYWTACFLLEAAEPLRVTVTAESPDVAEVVAAGLAGNPEIAIIERSQAGTLFDAVALGAIFQDGDKRRRLVAFLGAERILDIRRADGSGWDLRVIDAASGRLLGSEVAGTDLEPLAEAAVRLLARLPAKLPRRGATVAVLDFAGRTETDEAVAVGLLRLASDLRLRLMDAGCDVLDRAASAQIRNEHALAEEGWVDSEAHAMEGANYLVTGKFADEDRRLRLSVLDATNGRVVAREDFSNSFEDAGRMAGWILQTMGLEQETAPAPPIPSRQIEALEPFYRGIALAREGRDLEAIDEFQKAYSLNDKFVEAYLWEAECYERLGLAPLAVAMKAFVDRNMVGKGISSANASAAAEGVTFLGVAGAGGRNLELLVPEAAAPVFGKLLLPENLATFRDEYDALLGVKNSRGSTWAVAPGFLTKETLSGRIEKDAFALELRETAPDRLLASVSVPLGRDGSVSPRVLSAAMRQLEERAESNKERVRVTRFPEPSETSANAGILRQALEDASGLAARWQPLQKPSYNLPRALNLGLREYLLTKLPPEDPRRPWLELEYLAGFLPFDPWARPYVAAAPDPIAELKNFVRRHPNDMPGLLAEYMLLWETMPRLSYEELAQRWDELDKKLSRTSSGEPIAGWDKFRRMPAQLRDLARVAQGRGGVLPPCDDWFAAPHRMIPRVAEAGRVSLENTSPWGVSEWRHMSRITPTDAAHEARAALAILGRGNNRFAVNPRWMEEFPNALSLTSYVIRSLREADRDEGLPLRFPLDAPAERAAYLEKVRYVHAQLRREIALVQSPRELDWIENAQLREFFSALSRPGFRRTLPDSEVRKMQETVFTEIDGAAARVGRNARRPSGDPLRDWRRIDRSVSSFADSRRWTFDQVNIYEHDTLAANAATLLEQSAGTPLLSSPWYRAMVSYPYATLTPVQRAELITNGCERLVHDYGHRDLSAQEMEHLTQFAAALIAGKKYPEAAAVLRLVAETPESDANRTGKAVAVRANAALPLAALAIHAGREVEAAHALRRILADAPVRPIEIIEDGGWHPRHFESVQAVALRLLSELRAAESPPRADNGLVRVAVPGFFPGKVLFRYRAPSGGHPADGSRMPVLVIAPAVNEGADDYCREEGAWARFADAHGVFLLVPQFMEFWSDSTLPQDWSGEALRLALAKLRNRFSLDTDLLYFHGFGFGASFLQRVALWKPDWCGAASLHSTFDWAWEETLPEGLQALSALRNTPFFITCGAEDGSEDHAIRGSFAPTIRFVTYAKDAGVPVTWKPLPGVTHRPTREMEDQARAFLAQQFARRTRGGHP